MHRFPLIRNIPIRIIFLVCLLIPLGLQADAPYYFKFHNQFKDAYRLALQLRLEEARINLEQGRKAEPRNQIVYLVENYSDFFRVFISEDEALYRKLSRNREKRLSRLRMGDRSSPYYLYAQAEISLQWALADLKFGEYLRAFLSVRDAYSQLEENIRRFPGFRPHYKSMGILHMMLTVIPSQYRWGFSLLSGMEGNIDQGYREISLALQEGRQSLFYEETLVLYSLLSLHLQNESERAWKVLQESGLDPASNPLACFILSNVAIRTGHSAAALEYLEQQPRDPAFYPLPFLEYLEGLALLYKGDPRADLHFQKFLDLNPGQNYRKECCQKLAWSHWLRQDLAGYQAWMKQVLAQGGTRTGGDKAAQEEAKAGTPPHRGLLSARLLFDGGYYPEALSQLGKIPAASLKNPVERLEHAYRMGRIFQKTGKHRQALELFDRVIASGLDKTYFPCNAALQAGLICESTGQFQRAGHYFRICLDLEPAAYATSLHQLAQAGLDRISRK